MNYLAHAYLSFNNADVLTGNMISDFVKGKKQYDYPLAVQHGIQLHRAIDDFTDTHEATKGLKEFFRPHYRLYAGAFGDVVYDYFLARDRTQFETDDALMQFSQQCYQQLDGQTEYFGNRFGIMYPYMKEQNWLYSYQHEKMIAQSFEGMRRRSAYIQETSIAFDIFMSRKNDMQQFYNSFFPDVKIFAADKLEQLLK